MSVILRKTPFRALLSIGLLVILLGGFFIFAASTYAVEGTCSYHGGVDCRAGADWDGSAVCNDGWRNSSEDYYSQKMCTQNLHYCSTAVSQQLTAKYKLDELYATANNTCSGYEQYLPEPNDTVSETREKAIKALDFSSKCNVANSNYKSANLSYKQECYAIGATEYAAIEADLYKQYRAPPATHTSTVDVCVAGGIAHSHQVGTSCVCDSGFNQYNGQCYNIIEFCPLVLGAGGIAYDTSNCACKSGYLYNATKKYCDLMAVPVPVNGQAKIVTKQDPLAPKKIESQTIKPKTEAKIFVQAVVTSTAATSTPSGPQRKEQPAAKSRVIKRFFSWVFSFF